MRRDRLTIDQRPGSLPEIRTDDASIIFAMSVPGVPRSEHLIIRCDAHGDIWIAIASDDDTRV